MESGTGKAAGTAAAPPSPSRREERVRCCRAESVSGAFRKVTRSLLRSATSSMSSICGRKMRRLYPQNTGHL